MVNVHAILPCGPLPSRPGHALGPEGGADGAETVGHLRLAVSHLDACLERSEGGSVSPAERGMI
jgi:hypothetical protein